MANGMTLQQWGQYVAQMYQVPWNIFYNQIQQESGWNPNVGYSSAGAQGIAQIMPDTANSWGVNPWDPYAALQSAAKHMSMYYSQYGNSWTNALIAYNAGGGRVGTPFNQLPLETQNYVNSILGKAGVSPGASTPSGSTPSNPGTGWWGVQCPDYGSWQTIVRPDCPRSWSPTATTWSDLIGGGKAPAWLTGFFQNAALTLGAIVLIGVGGIWVANANKQTIINTATKVGKAATLAA